MTRSENQPISKERLAAYLVGEVPEPERHTIEAALLEHDSTRRSYADINRIRNALAAPIPSPPGIDLPQPVLRILAQPNSEFEVGLFEEHRSGIDVDAAQIRVARSTQPSRRKVPLEPSSLSRGLRLGAAALVLVGVGMGQGLPAIVFDAPWIRPPVGVVPPDVRQDLSFGFVPPDIRQDLSFGFRVVQVLFPPKAEKRT